MRRHTARSKNSTKILVVTAVVAALVFALFAVFSGTKNETAIAKINGKEIYKSEIEQKLHSVFDSQDQAAELPALDSLPPEVIKILAKEIYLERELTKEAKASKAAKSPELKGKIAENENRLIRQAYLDSIIKPEITEEKLSEKYVELSGEINGKKEYRLAHIVLKNEEDAKKIAKELKSKKFEELAKKHSVDQESAQKGGDLGYIVESNIVPELSAAVTKLKKGETSAPVQTKFGWHLVKVLDIRDAKALPFENIKDTIRAQLIQDKITEINSRITKNAEVEILIELKSPEDSQEKGEIKTGDATSPNEAVPSQSEEETKDETTTEEKKEEIAEKKKEEKSEKHSEKKSSKKSHDKKSNKK